MSQNPHQLMMRENRILAIFTAAITLFAIVVFPVFLSVTPERIERLTLPVIFHSLSMVTWFMLFACQALLIARHKHKQHRMLGRLSLILVVCLVVSAMTVSFSIAHEFEWADGILIINSFQMLCFIPLFIAAVLTAMKRKLEAHKRLILFAAMCLLAPPLDRFVRVLGLDVIWGLYLFPVVGITIPLLFDFLSRGRIHRVTLYSLIYFSVVVGGMFLVLMNPEWRSVFRNLLIAS